MEVCTNDLLHRCWTQECQLRVLDTNRWCQTELNEGKQAFSMHQLVIVKEKSDDLALRHHDVRFVLRVVCLDALQIWSRHSSFSSLRVTWYMFPASPNPCGCAFQLAAVLRRLERLVHEVSFCGCNNSHSWSRFFRVLQTASPSVRHGS